jgi:hypothetical protein
VQPEPASIVHPIGATAIQAAMLAAIATLIGGTVPIVIADVVGVTIVVVVLAVPPSWLASPMILVSSSHPAPCPPGRVGVWIAGCREQSSGICIGI